MQNAGTTGRPLNFLSLASKAGKQGCGCTSTHSRVGDDPVRTGRTDRRHQFRSSGHCHRDATSPPPFDAVAYVPLS